MTSLERCVNISPKARVNPRTRTWTTLSSVRAWWNYEFKFRTSLAFLPLLPSLIARSDKSVPTSENEPLSLLNCYLFAVYFFLLLLFFRLVRDKKSDFLPDQTPTIDSSLSIFNSDSILLDSSSSSSAWFLCSTGMASESSTFELRERMRSFRLSKWYPSFKYMSTIEPMNTDR